MDGKNMLTSLATDHFNQQYRNEKIGNALRSVQHRTTDTGGPELRNACREMESLFLTYLLKEMRAGTSGGGGNEFTPCCLATGATVFFVANDGTTGLELWKTNGTTAGTVVQLDDIRLDQRDFERTRSQQE